MQSVNHLYNQPFEKWTK